MGDITRPSAQRLKTILQRQEPPRWGAEYIPSTLATREEAPAVSQASTLASATSGRTFHALSSPERAFILFALYHPYIFEVQEQRMLSRTPTRHPLDSCPMVEQSVRPSLRGTVTVAEDLGLLDHHPTFHFEYRDSTGKTQQKEVPFPYTGDILVFFRDSQGTAAANWSIKKSPADFQRPAFGSRKYRESAEGKAKTIARHYIEKVYYADADIPTLQLTPEDWSKELRANLEQLFSWHDRRMSVPAGLTPRIVNHFKYAIGSDHNAIDIAIQLASRHSLKLEDVKAVFYQAIWKRELRIDLFEPIAIDKPMLPEKSDPIEKYSHWLRRK